MLPSIDEIPDRVLSFKGLRAPGGAASLELGGSAIMRGVTVLSDSGESAQQQNQIDGLRAITPRTRLIADGSFPGVGPTSLGEGNQFRFEVFGGTDAESKTVSGDERIVISFTVVFTAYVTAQKWRGTQGKMHYDVIDNTTFDGNPTLLYTSQDGPPIDFDNPTNPSLNEVLDINQHPNFQTKDHNLTVEWFSADGNPMTMLGQNLPIGFAAFGIKNLAATQFVPFIETEFNDFVTRAAATQEYASEWYASTGFTGGTTATVLSDTVTPVKIAGTYIAGNLKNFTESTGVITYTQEVIPFLSSPAIPYTSDGRQILRIDATATIPQTSDIETDVIQVGIYRNNTLIPNTLKSKISGVSFGRATPKPLDFHMEAIIEDAEEGDDYDVRILNTSNATNIAATDCDLRISF